MNASGRYEYSAERSATVADRWVGTVTDKRDGRVVMRTLGTFDTSGIAQDAAIIAWANNRYALTRVRATFGRWDTIRAIGEEASK